MLDSPQHNTDRHRAYPHRTQRKPAPRRIPIVEQIHLRHRFSRNTLLLMGLVAMIVIGLLVWQQDLLHTIYLTNQLTTLGLVVNGAILVLFLLGVMRLISLLLHYMREEEALERFVRNLGSDTDDLLTDIPVSRLIARRYLNMRHLHEVRTVIDQNALASTLVAQESTRSSLPKFINNILILTGVFGTILSLAIALLGASDLLGNSVDVHGMGLVVHGMSTALSTTITAILCYLFFGFFYLKLTDAQTNLVSGIEEVTATWLIPRFQVQTESVLNDFSALLDGLQHLVQQMQSAQQAMTASHEGIDSMLHNFQEGQVRLSYDMANIIDLLKRGFRLRDDEA